MAQADDPAEESAPGDLDDERSARVELLAEENRRLREEVRRARRTRTRRTAGGLAAVGVLALSGAVVLPGVREVLLALSGTGLFAAVLVRSLTPERFVAAPVGERIYEAHAETGRAVVADLGLSEQRVYLPTDTATGAATSPVRLFVPQTSRDTPDDVPETPVRRERDGAFAVTDAPRGVLWCPTGAGLYHEFEQNLVDEAATGTAALGEQIVDALVDGFELVDGAVAEAGSGRLSVTVEEGTYGDVDRFDHPVSSFVGSAVAATREHPVTVETTAEDGADPIVTVRWDDSAD